MSELASKFHHYHPIPSIYLQFSETMTKRILPRIFSEKTLAHQGAEEALLSIAKERNQKNNPCVGRAFFRLNAFRGQRVDAAESLGREITRFNEEFLNGQPGRPMSAAKFFSFPRWFFLSTLSSF